MNVIRKFIRKILAEIFVNEADVTVHSGDRVDERIEVMTDEDITDEEKEIVLNNVKKLEGFDFDVEKTFAVYLGSVEPNPGSSYYRNGYYILPAFDPREEPSIGNQFWAVIRSNKIATIFLRKEIQTFDDAKNAHNLKTDFSIKDIDMFISENS